MESKTARAVASIDGDNVSITSPGVYFHVVEEGTEPADISGLRADEREGITVVARVAQPSTTAMRIVRDDSAPKSATDSSVTDSVADAIDGDDDYDTLSASILLEAGVDSLTLGRIAPIEAKQSSALPPPANLNQPSIAPVVILTDAPREPSNTGTQAVADPVVIDDSKNTSTLVVAPSKPATLVAPGTVELAEKKQASSGVASPAPRASSDVVITISDSHSPGVPAASVLASRLGNDPSAEQAAEMKREAASRNTGVQSVSSIKKTKSSCFDGISRAFSKCFAELMLRVSCCCDTSSRQKMKI